MTELSVYVPISWKRKCVSIIRMYKRNLLICKK